MSKTNHPKPIIISCPHGIRCNAMLLQDTPKPIQISYPKVLGWLLEVAVLRLLGGILVKLSLHLGIGLNRFILAVDTLYHIKVV